MAAASAPSETAHDPPPSSTRTSFALDGSWAPSAVRVLYCEAILWCVSRLSRRRRRTQSYAATIVRGDGLLVAVGDGDYGPLTNYRNSRTHYVVREYNQVFTFDNPLQYLDFNTNREGLFELVNTLRSDNSAEKGGSTSFKSEICTKFLPCASVFCSKWDDDMVPFKLRLLISNMQQLAAHGNITWPAMLVEVDTGRIFCPVETDEYGRPVNGSTAIDAD